MVLTSTPSILFLCELKIFAGTSGLALRRNALYIYASSLTEAWRKFHCTTTCLVRKKKIIDPAYGHRQGFQLMRYLPFFMVWL